MNVNFAYVMSTRELLIQSYVNMCLIGCNNIPWDIIQ